ncbi:MAG: VOC family protein [Thalassotalea sp.]|nr:VOC family protein [Thalassotalea sp.]MDG2392242.1 VOC family protein [Thalassotalea sp.]
MSQHEKINYLEFPASDMQATKTFYSDVFAWQLVDYGPDYCSFNDGTINGGFYKSDVNSSYEQGSILIVFYSNHLEETAAKVLNNNGKIVKPIFEFPGGRRFHFTDPSGNELAVWSDR